MNLKISTCKEEEKKGGKVDNSFLIGKNIKPGAMHGGGPPKKKRKRPAAAMKLGLNIPMPGMLKPGQRHPKLGKPKEPAKLEDNPNELKPIMT
eukprot:UN10674